MAKKDIALDLHDRFPGIILELVRVTKPKFHLEYLSDILRLLIPTLEMPIDPTTANVKDSETCENCGRTRYELSGHEIEIHEEEIDERWVMVGRTPRKPGDGFQIPRERLQGMYWFSSRGFTFVKEEVKNYIEENGWTNVRFLEYGETI